MEDIEASNSDDFLCRTCLKALKELKELKKMKTRNCSNSTKKYYNLFATEDFLKKYLSCTSLTAVPSINDGLPAIICDKCFRQINSIHDFQEMCKISELKLQKRKSRLYSMKNEEFSSITRQLDSDSSNFHMEEDEKPISDLDGNLEKTFCRTEYMRNRRNSSDGEGNAVVSDIKQERLEEEEINQNELKKMSAKRDVVFLKIHPSAEHDADSENHTTVEATFNVKNIKAEAGNTKVLKAISDEHIESLNNSESDGDADSSDEDVDRSEKVNEAESFDWSEMSGISDSVSDSDADRDEDPCFPRKPRKRDKRKNRGRKVANHVTFLNCDRCPKRFMVEHKLIAHKRKHDGLKPYPCTHPDCMRGFNRSHTLSSHMRLHTDSSQAWFRCQEPDCDKMYQHNQSLKLHMRKTHGQGPEIKQHCCEICGKIFGTAMALTDHRYTHKDKSERPYACDQPNCNRRFVKKDKLKNHMLRHAGIKNFVCPECGLRKTTRNELTIHMKYHNKSIVYPCQYCTAVFHNSGNLKRHVRVVHEGLREYACRFCEKRFGKPDTRKYHEMTHTGEKPNECTECGKRFIQPAALRTHKKVHNRQREKEQTHTQATEANNVAQHRKLFKNT